MAKRRRPKVRHIAFSALEVNDLDMIRMKLADEPDLAHVKDLKGQTLLMSAVYTGRREAIEMLLESAAPIDAFEAAALGRSERLGELLEAGDVGVDDLARDGFGLLHLACFFGHEETARLLLDRGASPETLATHPMGVRPAHSAAASRHRDLIDLLLDRGADVNGRQGGGFTLLHHAALHGDRDLAESLIARGADASAKNERDQSPADLARERGHEELATLLDGA